jgi:hypothetical protein
LDIVSLIMVDCSPVWIQAQNTKGPEAAAEDDAVRFRFRAF